MKRTRPDLEPCYTVADVAQRWRCRPSLVRKLMQAGRLKFIELPDRRRGKKVRITPEALRQAELGPMSGQPTPDRQPRETFSREVLELMGEA